MMLRSDIDRRGHMSQSPKPWLIRRSRRGGPPREVLRDLVDVPVDGVTATVFVIRWETEDGPVLYFAQCHDGRRVSTGELAWRLCVRLVEPHRWAGAVLIEPYAVDLELLVERSDIGPHVDVQPMAFTTDRDGEHHLGRGSRQLAERIGRRLGADLPIWPSGTHDVATARAALAGPGRTLAVPDNSAWRRHEATLLRGVRAGLPEAYPLAWAAMAVEFRLAKDKIIAGHARLPDRGRGWYLAARPRIPEPPEELRRLLDAAAVPGDRGSAAAREVIELEAAANAMDRDDPRLDAYTGAAGRLSHLMYQDALNAIVARAPRTPHLDRVRAARPIPVTATWAGPVVRTWLRTLTPVPDLPAVLRQRRIGEILRFTRDGEDPRMPTWRHSRPGEVREAYRDRNDRYVLVLADTDGPDPAPWMCAEWHRDPAVAATWTGGTVLAADRPVPGGPAGPMLLLTPEGDGEVRADPFPAALVDGGPLSFEFGDRDDHRDAVLRVMRQLLMLALDAEAAEFAARQFVLGVLTEHPGMTLWPALTAPQDTLRLRWDAIRAGAAADVAHVRRLLAPGAPALYRYFAVLRSDTAPLDELFQVVRQSLSPAGHEKEECIAPDGSWAQSFLLLDINHGKSDDDARPLRPDQADRYVARLRAARA